VTLNKQFQFGIDWQKVVFVSGGQFRALATPYRDPSPLNLLPPNLPQPSPVNPGSLISPGGGASVRPNALTLLFQNKSVKAIVNALKEQGEVRVISQPRLRTLNNQTAMMKVGTDQPFFTHQTSTISSSGGLSESSGDTLTIITVGTVLAVTPQIASDDWITLDITPAITSFVEEVKSPSGESSAPVLDIKQFSTIVRMRDGETIVLGGLIQNSHSKTVRKIPLLGDIPLLGRLFQGTVDAKQKKELVIFLTPRIVR
jgi:MSHA type pilus biogenesis protein MshL